MFLLIILLADWYMPLQGVWIELTATEIARYTHISWIGVRCVRGRDVFGQGEGIGAAGCRHGHGHSIANI